MRPPAASLRSGDSHIRSPRRASRSLGPSARLAAGYASHCGLRLAASLRSGDSHIRSPRLRLRLAASLRSGDSHIRSPRLRLRLADPWLLLGILLLAACEAPPPQRAEPDLATQAAQALDRAEYAKAADLYRRALEASPDSLPLHYGLAVAASYLDLKEEAIREFRWVLERGAPGSAEVEAARRWLASVGALPRPAVAAMPAGGERELGNASLDGQVVFGEGQDLRPMVRKALILVGQPDTPTKEERYNLRTGEEGRYRFPNVAPGPYMLTDRVAGPVIWRLRVELQPSQEMTLNLTPANSVKVRDDFPNLK